MISAEDFYNSYHQYFIDNIKMETNINKIYKYVFYCYDNDKINCLEGGSMEEIYYKILFKIDNNCCNDIYKYLVANKYSFDVSNNILKDPIKLLKTHYLNTEYYIFKEINFIHSNINKELIDPNIKIKINKTSEKAFYESYEKYYLRKVKFNISPTKYQYILICKELSNIFFLEGYSIEELYYIIFFKIDNQCWENLYDSEYSMEELKKPIELFKHHYLDSDEFIFRPIKLI